MPQFAYKAVSGNGEVSTGTLSAANQLDAISQIRATGGIPIYAEQQTQSLWTTLRANYFASGGQQKLGGKLETFALQMASLIGAGVAVDEALRIIQETEGDAATRSFAATLDSAIREGQSLAAAVEAAGVEVPRIGVNILRTSEASGNLAGGFASLAAFLQRSRESRQRLKASLTYPAILAFVSALSLIAIFTFVVPQFAQLFADLGDALPLLTRAVMATAGFLSSWGWLLILIGVAGIVVFRSELKKPQKRRALHAWLLGMPKVGDLLLAYQTERYCRSLATLLDSGLTLTSAMAIARESLDNLVLADAAAQAEQQVGEGMSVSSALAGGNCWPALTIQLIRVGERTGDLSKMLRHLAETFERETRLATDRLLTLLEPLLVVALGFVIAIIIIAVLMGIMSANDLPF